MENVNSHWLDVRDKPVFLRAMMDDLAGDAHIALEGDLSRCRFAEEFVVDRDEFGVLKRITLSPVQDFVVLRLVPESVEPIFKQVLAAGLKRAIIHIQIERRGVLELGAYDNFHPNCVVTGPGVTSILLGDLKSKNVIREFNIVAEGG